MDLEGVYGHLMDLFPNKILDLLETEKGTWIKMIIWLVSPSLLLEQIVLHYITKLGYFSRNEFLVPSGKKTMDSICTCIYCFEFLGDKHCNGGEKEAIVDLYNQKEK